MNTMICRFEEEWAALDRRVRMEEIIRQWMLRLALFTVAMAVVFILVSYIAAHAESGGYDAWAQTCADYRQKQIKEK